MATRRRPKAAHAQRMGPDSGRRKAPSRSGGGRSGSSRGRRRRGAHRPAIVRSAAILTLVAAAVFLVGAQLGTWDGIFQPNHVADRTALPAAGSSPRPVAAGPIVWATGQDLAERGERVRREGRPIPPADLTGYRWPLEGAVLTNRYGPSRAGTFVLDGERFHDGVDLSTKCGDPIVAAHSGIVLAAGRDYDAFIGWLGDLTAYHERLDAQGLWDDLAIVVVVDDGNGYRSVYAHFRSVDVVPGQRIQAGDLLGLEGRTGNATGCHLHYAIFSPHETATIQLRRAIANRTHLPLRSIARIDPLLVLPPLETGGITLPD